MHDTLNLPDCELKIRNNPETQLEEVYDIQRKKFVRLTPEEWVRQPDKFLALYVVDFL